MRQRTIIITAGARSRHDWLVALNMYMQGVYCTCDTSNRIQQNVTTNDQNAKCRIHPLQFY